MFSALLILAIALCVSAKDASNVKFAAGVKKAHRGPEPILNITLDGAIVAAKLRCEGYLCPQWALEIWRHDYVQQLGTEFEYKLQELLPLAPTVERSMRLFSAYDASTRVFSLVASNYPESGIDTHFVSKINSDITAAEPVFFNVMIPHPDASVANPGSLSLVKMEAVPGGSVFALFTDGSIYEVDLKNQRYNALGSLFHTAEDKASLFLTEAHVLDGTTWKSFVIDARGTSYLIKTDTTVTPFKAAAPVKVQPLQGEPGQETPVAAHMVSPGGDAAPQLLLINHGNFDSLSFVDETTGASTNIIGSLASDDMNQPALIYCNPDIKECDTWQTSAYDPVSKILYFQAHYIDTQMDTYDDVIYGLEFFKNTVTAGYSPIANIAVNSWFGYSSFQFVTMA